MTTLGGNTLSKLRGPYMVWPLRCVFWRYQDYHPKAMCRTGFKLAER